MVVLFVARLGGMAVLTGPTVIECVGSLQWYTYGST